MDKLHCTYGQQVIVYLWIAGYSVLMDSSIHCTYGYTVTVLMDSRFILYLWIAGYTVLMDTALMVTLLQYLWTVLILIYSRMWSAALKLYFCTAVYTTIMYSST